MTTAPGPTARKNMSERHRKERCSSCPKEADLARLETRQDSFDERLEAMFQSQARLLKKIDELIPAVARLEVKAGIWGAVGGVLAALAVIAVAFASRL